LTKSLPTLAEHLKAKIKEKFGPQREAADALRLNHAMLRKSLSENAFYLADLDILRQAFSLPSVEDLQRQFTFDVLPGVRGARRRVATLQGVISQGVPALASAFDLLRSEAKRLRGPSSTIGQAVERLYKVMSDGDLLILVLSDEPAVEWTESLGVAVLDDVAAAVRKGACICYLFPSARMVDALTQHDAAQNAKLPAAFERLFNDFKERLGDLGKGCVVYATHDAPAYFVPGHKFAMYRHFDEKRPQQWGVGAYPVDTGKLTGQPVADRLVLPLMHDVAEQLFRFCRKTVQGGVKHATSDQKACLLRVLKLLEAHSK